MARRSFSGFLFAVLAWAGAGAGSAAAQSAPDIRDVRPVIMLLVDTSGSMDRLPGCVCSTPGCTECLPMCTSSPDRSDRSKWTNVVEALTGSFEGYTCTSEDRNGPAYLGQYDYGYYIPHARIAYTAQRTDGILDSYLDRAKFGLMTFDNVGTFSDTGALIGQTLFRSRIGDSITAVGDYSYGDPKLFSLPGCIEPYMLDNGARNENAPIGRLVSVGSDLLDDSAGRNGLIQSTLLGVRPFGPTPIAGMLDDVRHYFANHPDVRPVGSSGGDAYFQCRNRFVILLTDGAPSAEMRESPFNCESPGASCPFDRPEEIAADLCDLRAGSGTCEGTVDGVFVIGFDVSDPAVSARLDDIAALGGTGEALLATDRSTLMARLTAAIDAAAPGTTTRTVPAFSNPQGDSNIGQHQFGTGFSVSTGTGGAWSGVLYRRRFQCDGVDVEEQPVRESENDLFHEVLNDRTAARRLLTVVPSRADYAARHLVGEDPGVPTLGGGGSVTRGGRGRGGASCTSTRGSTSSRGPRGVAQRDLRLSPFATSNASLTRQYFGVATDTERTAIINWVHGNAGSGREDRRLGDIYHSSPVVVGPPVLDIPDESYNLFRQRPEVATRPTVLYVGTNDGILHAFATEDATVERPDGSRRSVTAGEELWGFVPPMLFGKLQSARSSHQWMVDATPLVKEVFYRRLPGAPPDASIYHTVLITGLRGGGNGYIAIDVTDPLDPKFMWQFTEEDLGATYGTPALGQILVQGADLEERAFAMLPGGLGTDITEDCGGAEIGPDGRLTKPLGCPARGAGRPPVTEGTLNARDHIRCWDTTGRQVYFVDVATGELISHFDDTTFNSPLSGGASFFSGEVGTIATRAYLTDADGVIWRFDFSNPNPRNWAAAPLHDIFWDGGAAESQPAYAAPILTTDNDGNVVIIQGTGNIDKLDGLAANKVVSLTERLTFDTGTGGVDALVARLNWEIALEEGEQVTGPLELFDSKVYFGTFNSSTSTSDACAFGFSRLWGVDYRRSEGGTNDPLPGFDEDEDGVDETRFLGPFDNEIIMGVAVTQRPSCFVGGPDTDFYYGRPHYRVTGGSPGEFQLVAQSSGGTRLGGGAVSEIRRTLPAPESFTLPQSWAGTIE